MIKKTLLVTACLFCITSNTMQQNKPMHFIFDLPNTLIAPNKVKFFKDIIGISGVLYSLWYKENLAETQQSMYSILNNLGTQRSEHLVRDPENCELPQIFCDFLKDGVDAATITTKLNTDLREALEEKSPTMKNIIAATFNSDELAKHTAPIQNADTFIEFCKEISSEPCYILANWEAKSFDAMFDTKKYSTSTFFQTYFLKHNIFISGRTKQLLPNPEAFQYFFEKTNLNPSCCIFVSGMQHHIKAASTRGINTILIEKNNFNKAKSDLEALVEALIKNP